MTTRVQLNQFDESTPIKCDHIELETGLGSPHAETLLRSLDPDNRYRLLSATDAKLGQFATLTAGNPRALLSIGSILASAREASVDELLTSLNRSAERPTTDKPSDRTERVAPVVDVLIGESFNRLDVPGQRAMQALAVYSRAVPVGAIDYLLQPFTSGLDAQQILSELHRANLIQQETKGYYLHPIDREYALTRLPRESTGSTNWNLPALRKRAAACFQSIRLPRSKWKSLADLAPQRAEFDLLCESKEYSAANEILDEITGDFLFLWGHSQLALDLHERLNGHLTNPSQRQWNAGFRGLAFGDLGRVHDAIAAYEMALKEARAIPDRQGEEAHLGNLGNAYSALGDARRAIEYYEQALEIADDVERVDVQQCYRFEKARLLADVDELQEATRLAEAAVQFDVPQCNAEAWFVLGVVRLKCGEIDSAQAAFQNSLEHAGHLLGLCDENYEASDCRGLALCGLAACGDSDQLKSVPAAFQQAATVRNKLDGYRKQRLQYFDSLLGSIQDEQRRQLIQPLRDEL